MKIVVNKCYGGFGLSPTAIQEYLKLKGKECFFYRENFKTKTFNFIPIEEASNYDSCFTQYYGASFKEDWDLIRDDYFYYGNIERNDKDLVQVVETLGSNVASGALSSLEVVEVPDDIQWEIDNYDGIETIHEIHRSW